jgi:hypothetical protein
MSHLISVPPVFLDLHNDMFLCEVEKAVAIKHLLLIDHFG